MDKAIVTLPFGRFTFDAYTGWSGGFPEDVALLNGWFPAGEKPAGSFAYQPDPLFAPAYAAVERLGGQVLVIARSEPLQDEISIGEPAFLVASQPPEPVLRGLSRRLTTRGGKGSGHRGHKGRKGKRGGSEPTYPEGMAPSDEKPEPEPEPPKATMEYERRLSGDKAWKWNDAWLKQFDGKNDWKSRFALKDLRSLRRRMNKEFAELANFFYRHPEEYAGKDLYTTFREDLDEGYRNSWMGLVGSRLASFGQEWNPAGWNEEQAKDAVADMFAAEFAAYYPKWVEKKQGSEAGWARKQEYRNSTKWLSPEQDFFSIPGTERWEPVQAGVAALTDAGLMLPESFKGYFSETGDNDGLIIKETRAETKFGSYVYMGSLASNISMKIARQSPGGISSTFVHEAGHMVEHLGFDWGSKDKHPEFVPYYDAVEPLHERLIAKYGRRRDYTDPSETFARLFVQYTGSKLKKAGAATRKKHSAFLSELDADVANGSKDGRYATWDEFRDIEKTMDVILEAGTWRKS